MNVLCLLVFDPVQRELMWRPATRVCLWEAITFEGSQLELFFFLSRSHIIVGFRFTSPNQYLGVYTTFSTNLPPNYPIARMIVLVHQCMHTNLRPDACKVIDDHSQPPPNESLAETSRNDEPAALCRRFLKPFSLQKRRPHGLLNYQKKLGEVQTL
ncbi:hypothetical protein BDN67DRAFT_702733 [Paxillus ammoniavirescens]|nr:hypothetical protein BDN67DRAFT_702733 [Paxillus ammoniavirescens]